MVSTFLGMLLVRRIAIMDRNELIKQIRHNQGYLVVDGFFDLSTYGKFWVRRKVEEPSTGLIKR